MVGLQSAVVSQLAGCDAASGTTVGNYGAMINRTTLVLMVWALCLVVIVVVAQPVACAQTTNTTYDNSAAARSR